MENEDKEPTQNYFALINNIPFFSDFSQAQKKEIAALNNRVDEYEPNASARLYSKKIGNHG